MATTVTLENVSRVEFLIMKDPQMTYAETQDIMKFLELNILYRSCYLKIVYTMYAS